MFDYETKVQHWVNRLSFLLRAEASRGLQAAGLDLTAEEWALMMVLWRDGPRGMGALADITLRERTTVTRVVDRLARKGLVERRPGNDDRRMVVIAPTDEGERIRAAVLGAMAPLVDGIEDGIDPDDLTATVRTLRRMAGRLTSTDQVKSD